MNSNIVAGSNVYLAKTDDPRRDPDFIAQILDYDRLKEIVERRKIDPQISLLSREQMSIVHRGIRCTFAKNDPCFGPLPGGRNGCKCINIECSGIYDRPSFYGKAPWKGCNPDITEEYIKQWSPDPLAKKQYGNPESLRRYYIVDMVSDEEMSRYDSNPKNEGYEYPIPKNPVLPNEQDKKQKEQKYKIDPITGRKMVVIGYRWVITDNATYESEELLPIWGFVEEVEEKKEETVTRKKAKRIEKKQDIPQKKKKLVKPTEAIRDPDYDRKEEFEKAVAASIVDEIKLTDVDPDVINDEDDIVVLLDNPAELAFVSGTFLISAISHGMKTDMPVRLALIDDYLHFTDRSQVMISNTALKVGCREANVQAWKALSKRKEIALLQVAEREFYKFNYGDQKSRWTCRNMYGVTHVCVDQEDIRDIEKLSDGIYPVSLVDDGNTYMILEKNGELLGRLGKSFVDVINALKDTEEISGPPAMINGISLQVQGNKAEFLGMGHLKFIEY